MKHIKTLGPCRFIAAALLALLSLNSQLSTARAQGTAFTYQGRLNSGTNAANGSYDLTFSLFNAVSGGAQIGGAVTNLAVGVTNGLFTTVIDFGSVFAGNPTWLAIGVRTNGPGGFVGLSPLQPITPAPYAVTAGSANNLAGLAVQPNAGSGAPNLIGGSQVNFVSGGVVGATIGGGGTTNYQPPGKPFHSQYTNSVTGSFGTVGGGAANTAAAQATVAGGQGNSASGQLATVGGGQGNNAGGQLAMVGGGIGNSASGNYATVAGGSGNVASASLGSGIGSTTVGGGANNTAGGDDSTVGGGFNNQATNTFASVPGGANNVAGGMFSFAAGNNAQALHSGAFVWADPEAGAAFTSTTTNQFNVRASGGVRFVTGGAGLTLDGQPVLTQLPATVALLSDPGTANFFAGQNTGNATLTGGGNTGVGAEALYNNSSGYNNTAQGFNSLFDDSTGYNNSAVGTYTMMYNTTGNNNTAIGAYALSAYNVPGYLTASANTASGAYALFSDESGYNNTAAGFQALYSSTTGFDNVAMGVATFYSLQSGSQNTAVGTYDFQNLINGSGNVGLGYYAGNSLINGNNNIYIGSPGLANETNVIRIGNGQSQTFISGALQGNIAINGGLNVDQMGQNIGNVNSNALTFGASSGEGLASKRNGANAYDLEFWTDFQNRMTIQQGGNVGINTPTPTAALDVNGEMLVVEGSGGVRCYIGDDGFGNDVQVGSLKHGATAVAFYNLTDSAYMHLYCSSITIEGGADLAEPFPISRADRKVSEGDVVVIDEANPGRLKLADQPYDTRVAGVVSGANGIHPGIQMQQQGLLEGGQNVALTGRVYVQADTSNGAIKPGDLLTTSATPGRAMRVIDHTRAQGAILGKAMTGLNQGQGMVLVLVTLQ